ncbi:hypothetical protein HPB52_002647 [Rhipicephalus sanguineus]|uniref:Uncharacterized protein n=1 Tax=Rhipicephalus sanguineus TaxID=34632 RepID=A0A9D4PBR7_RHISA|nr:hypothetical protein HPB52_002647 [Rhipicephalus sanguineus]
MVDYVLGPLNLEIMIEPLPSPDSGTMVLCCTPPQFIAAICEPAFRDIGHKSIRVCSAFERPCSAGQYELHGFCSMMKYLI